MFLGLCKLGNICCGHKMFLNKIRNIFCVPDTKFVSATNVASAGKRRNICVGNNVSATMCPRLPGPLGKALCSHSAFFQAGIGKFNDKVIPVMGKLILLRNIPNHFIFSEIGDTY